jgi:hypothetical protein
MPNSGDASKMGLPIRQHQELRIRLSVWSGGKSLERKSETPDLYTDLVCNQAVLPTHRVGSLELDCRLCFCTSA